VEEEARVLRVLFDNYLSGMSLHSAAENAGLHLPHGSVKKLLTRRIYIGDAYYPAIIDREIFTRVNSEVLHRAAKHNQGKRLKEPPIFKDFSMKAPKEQFPDPKQQAEYLYSLIEVQR
jgi:hypothetical protein